CVSEMASSTPSRSEEQFLCSICLEVFSEPVSTPCGHNFCKRCISQTWDTKAVCKCPLCNKSFSIRPELCTSLSQEFNKVFRQLPPKDGLRRVQTFAVDVTLDPDSAHPKLDLSEDLKQVHHTDVKKKLPDSPQRFDTCVNVLGKQSFSSGRFYFEVQVKGKTKWELGVAQNSVNRKGKIILTPKNGFWTIWLRDKDKYKALAGPSVLLSPLRPPQKVGVFVDYGAGLVSFYDVDSADLLYSFTGCCFREKLFPYFSPDPNSGGTNSAPLIISAVDTESSTVCEGLK
uniref:B30.2/SPRY domain-containing protein n=1 Tax=Neogobius melanostomus TaxID=47308 RepID=A0A8C6U9F7_9GOBI